DPGAQGRHALLLELEDGAQVHFGRIDKIGGHADLLPPGMLPVFIANGCSPKCRACRPSCPARSTRPRRPRQLVTSWALMTREPRQLVTFWAPPARRPRQLVTFWAATDHHRLRRLARAGWGERGTGEDRLFDGAGELDQA